MNKSYLTAIARTEPSAPAKRIVSTHFNLKQFKNILDYGCGRGLDAKTYGWDMWDPHYYPDFTIKDGYYDAVLCTYVLNTLTEGESLEVIKGIQRALNKNGVAFITVRRDLPRDLVLSAKGTYQRMVYLDLPIDTLNSKYCTYLLRKPSSTYDNTLDNPSKIISTY